MKNEEIDVTLYNTETGYEDIINGFNPDELQGYLNGMIEGIKDGIWTNTTITITIRNIKGTN